MEENKELVIKNISKIYGNKNKGDQEVVALKNVNFSVNKGEFVFIVGPSGAGKSTLLNILGGSLNERDLSKFRQNDIGFVFQFYNLVSSLSAYENVYLASSLVKKHFDPMQVLTLVGLENRANNFPSQLSGGEQQRVSIARALVKNPTLLLCDEPTGALDSKTGVEIMDLLYKVCKNQNKTVIVVTHNKALTVIADRIIEIQDGTVVKNYVIKNPGKVSDIVW